MDLPWERRADHHRLDDDALAQMLAPAFPNARVLHSELLPAGKCNSNYKVLLAGRAEPVLLRVYGRDPSACLREAALHRRLAGRIPLAAFHHAGATHEGVLCSILSWVDGVLLAEWLPRATPAEAASIARQLGTVLAVFQGERFTSAGFLAPDLSIEHAFDNVVDAYYAYAEDSLFRQPGAHVLGDDLALRLWSHMTANRALLAPASSHSHLTHCDFGPWNILVRETPAGPVVAAILDWEFASSGSFLADVGNLFRRRTLMPTSLFAPLADGIRERGGTLPDDWIRMARLFDLVALSGMAGLGVDRPALAEDVARLVAETLDEWPSLEPPHG